MRLLSSEEVASGTKFTLEQKEINSVSRWHKAAEFYGDHVETSSV
jgi:hypothetical protein